MIQLQKFFVFCLILGVFVSCANGFQITNLQKITNDPQKVQLIYDDVKNFERAYKLVKSGADPVKTYAEEYFGKATPGLKAYAGRTSLSPESLVKAINKRPAFYASLRNISERLAAQETAIRQALVEFKRVYPNVVYPPVYFLIGDISAGGLADPSGILISVEIYGLNSASGASKFSDVMDSLHPISDISHLVAHELAHIQQAVLQGVEKYRAIYAESGSLLALAIREGSADFLAFLASGNHINQKAHKYGNKNEEELWKLFKTRMLDKEIGDWFFVKPANPEHPPDLGYFMGYKITESFYRNAADKEKAILEILSVTDHQMFLKQSKYAEKFSGKEQ